MSSGRVPLHRIRVGSPRPLSPQAVAKRSERILDAPHDVWPAPVGTWEEDPDDGARTFVIFDRPENYAAAVLAGRTHLLVCWAEEG